MHSPTSNPPSSTRLARFYEALQAGVEALPNAYDAAAVVGLVPVWLFVLAHLHVIRLTIRSGSERETS